ncbi:MAG: xylulokinase [Thermomicrobiales bacterium]
MADGYLAIDLGTSAVKANVVDEQGRILGRGSAEHPMLQPRPGFAEQHPNDWWHATVLAVKQATAEAGEPHLRAIGLTGQMHGTVLLGNDGPLAPAIIWTDTRSGNEVQEITARIGARHLIETTGSPIATGFQAATIRWLQRHEPAILRQTRQILLPKDYLRWKLTGNYATDPSDASGTLLFDVRARNWSEEMLATLDVDRSLLPPVLPSSAVTGELNAGAAKQLQLPSGIPVIAGGGDAPCAALGAGIVNPGALLLTISTGAQVFLPTTKPGVDPEGRIHTFCAALEPGPNQPGWYQMGATMVAGLAMRWLRDVVFELPHKSGYEQMTAAASEVPPGASGLVFLPYLTGERTPHMDPNARGVLLGLTASHRRGHLVRAVMEGVAFALLDAFDVVRQFGAMPAQAVLAGGGARSVLWQQIIADLFGLPVVPLESADQSAVGAAMLAATGMEHVELLDVARSWSHYGAPIEPRADVHAHYEQLRPIFRQAYVKHREDFRLLTNMG